jgi:CspA family cold shock protein
MAKMQGIVSQFGTQGYGFIQGDDGEKYFFHKKEIMGKVKIRVKSKVKFVIGESEKGSVALKVSILKNKKAIDLPSTTTVFLSIIVILQVAILYFVAQ